MKMNFTFIRKFLLVQAIGLGFGFAASAQGWVGDGAGKLYPVNNGLGLTPVSVGIGTNAPTDQLHTTGTVRFQGLTQNDTALRVVTQGLDGRIYWRDLSSISTGGGWSLTGNSGTNPASNFLGTTDQQRLVFKTNSTERATILANGNVGIGVANPIKALQVDNRGVEDNNIYLSGASPSLYFSQSATFPPAPYNTPIGRLALATRTGAHVRTAKAGDMILLAATPGAGILFGVGTDGTNGIERARISEAGNLGINTTAPGARLHVNGTVRFENLPSGSGSALVIDANGNVYKGSTSGGPSDSIAVLRQEIEVLKEALAVMQQQLATLTSGAIEVTPPPSGIRAATLASAPNPVYNSTSIRYTYPDNVQKAYLNISDLSGQLLKRFDLSNSGSSAVTVTSDVFSTAGTYIYSLELDGRVTESKKLVVVK